MGQSWDDLAADPVFVDLRRILRRGLYRFDVESLGALPLLLGATGDRATAVTIRTRLLAALDEHGTGPARTAALALFRATSATRHLKTLDAARALAAEALAAPGAMPVTAEAIRKAPREATGAPGFEWHALRQLHESLTEPTPDPHVASDGTARVLPTKTATSSPSARLADALLAYARELEIEKRDHAVLKLRTGAGYLLHTQGLTHERKELGHIALAAAVRTNQHLLHIEILLDDLGWVEHQLGSNDIALENIERGIALAHDYMELAPSEDLAILRAKGLRHTAFILSADDLAVPRAALAAARATLDAPPCADNRAIRIERGQIDHASAYVVAARYGLLDDRSAPVAAPEAIADVTAALDNADTAARVFLAEHSMTRYAKALDLKEALLRGLRREAEAREVAIARDDALGKTSWRRQTTVIGG